MDAAGPSSDVNISDVIEVIETDEMYAGGPANGSEGDSRRPRAYVKITEQPASKALRFRYECEGRSAGSIPGVKSTPENKSFPAIQIVGHHGRAVVVVSCVTKDAPYRPHPHNLVGKEGCSRGVCTLKMNSDTITFSNLGIQCVKKKDIEEALKIREEIRVDPFRNKKVRFVEADLVYLHHTNGKEKVINPCHAPVEPAGFSHKVQPSSIDLNSVRLCFQVFLEGPKKDEFTIPLRPVVSDPIYDKKAMSDLTICKLSDCSASVAGGREIILLCEKVAKEDIQVRFYEERDGELYWEGQGDFQPTHVHKQVAISFRTPKYKHIDADKPVKVWMQLRRPSDGAVSESVPFQFVPLDSDPAVLKRKRQKYGGESSPQNILRQPQDDDSRSTFVESVSPDRGYHMLQVKREPSETSPNPYMYGGDRLSPMYPGTSPGPTSPHSTPSPVPYTFPTNFNVNRHNSGGGLIEIKSGDMHGFKPQVVYPSPGPSKQNLEVAQMPYPHLFPSSSPLNDLNNTQLYGQGLPVQNILPTKIGSTNLGTTDIRMASMPKVENDPSRSQFPAATGNTMLDMDSHQYSLELSLNNLDSAELTRMALMTDANLSENLSSNLTLDDKNGKSSMDYDQGNMTDSFTRAAIQELVSLNNLDRTSQE